MSSTVKDTVYALRCTNTPGGKCEKLDACPYYMAEEIPEEFKAMKPDFVKDGKKYVHSCNIDKICFTAADLLEGFDGKR